MFKKWFWSRAQRQTYNELSRMTDGQLRDIGITRGEIWHVVESMKE